MAYPSHCPLPPTQQGDNLFNLFGHKLFTNASHYMLAAAAIMIPTVWLPDLSSLSYLGFLGVSATTTVVCSVRCIALQSTLGGYGSVGA